jgi:hypothetical protein
MESVFTFRKSKMFLFCIGCLPFFPNTTCNPLINEVRDCGATSLDQLGHSEFAFLWGRIYLDATRSAQPQKNPRLSFQKMELQTMHPRSAQDLSHGTPSTPSQLVPW